MIKPILIYCYVLKNLRYVDELKGCEKQLGSDRGELDRADGYFAVLLWFEFHQTMLDWVRHFQ